MQSVKTFEVTLMRALKMAPRSDIWRFFVRSPWGGKCHSCGVIVKTSGNTVNLWKHLEIHHPQLTSDDSGPKKLKKEVGAGSDATKSVNTTEPPIGPVSSPRKVTNKRVITIDESFAKVSSYGGEYI